MLPDWELNWWPFGLQAGTQSTRPHQPGHCKTFRSSAFRNISEQWQRWNYCNQSFLDKAEYLPATPNWFSFPPWKRNRKELENIQGTEMIPKWGALFGGNLMQKNGELAGLGVSCLLSFINNSLGRLWNLWIFTLIYALAPLCKEFAVICGILSMIQTWWRPLTMTFGSVCGMYSHHNVKRNNFQSQVRG